MLTSSILHSDYVDDRRSQIQQWEYRRDMSELYPGIRAAITILINRLNAAGVLVKPKGCLVYWYNSSPVEKAVIYLPAANGIWWYQDNRSSDNKYLVLLKWLTASAIHGKGKESFFVTLFTARQSTQMRSLPFLYRTAMSGNAQEYKLCSIMPWSNNFSSSIFISACMGGAKHQYHC